MGSDDGDAPAPVPHQPPPPCEDESSMGGMTSSEDSYVENEWGWHSGEWKEQKPGVNGWYHSKWNQQLGSYDPNPVWVWHESMDDPSTDTIDVPMPWPEQIPNLPAHDPEDDSAYESESGCPVFEVWSKHMWKSEGVT